jgi:hypothetical protein
MRIEQNSEPTNVAVIYTDDFSSRRANRLKGIQNLDHAHSVPATVRVEVAVHTPPFIKRNMPERHRQRFQASHAAVLDRQMVVTFRGAPVMNWPT